MTPLAGRSPSPAPPPPRATFLPTVVLGIVLAVASCTTSPSIETWTGQGTLVIEGATVFTSPGVEPIQNAVLIVIDGIVEAVGVSSELPVPPPDLWIDGSGFSVLSGFWNAYVRMDAALLAAAAEAEAADLQTLLQERFTRFGFTSVVDTGTPIEELSILTSRIESGEVMGPRIISAEAGNRARVSFPDPSHPSWSAELLAGLAGEDVAVVPALGFVLQARAAAAESGAPDAAGGEALSSIRDFVDVGGRLVFGTGSGYFPQYDPMTEHLLLEEGGVPFSDRLASLTTEPATRFDDYVGQLSPGMVADLVLVEGDPEVDVTAFGRVRLVLREGRPLFW